MDEAAAWARGKKTYIVALVGLVATWLAVLFGEPVLGQPVMPVREAIEATVGLVLAMTIRAGVGKTEEAVRSAAEAGRGAGGGAPVLLLCVCALGAVVGIGGCAGTGSESQKYAEASRVYTATLRTVTPLIQAGVLDADDIERFEIVRAPAGRLLDQWERALKSGRAFDGAAALDALLNELVQLESKGREATGGTPVPPEPNAERQRKVIDERAGDRGGSGGDSGGAGDRRGAGADDRGAPARATRAHAGGDPGGHERAPARREDLRGGLPRYWRERECGYRRPVFAAGGGWRSDWGGLAGRAGKERSSRQAGVNVRVGTRRMEAV